MQDSRPPIVGSPTDITTPRPPLRDRREWNPMGESIRLADHGFGFTAGIGGSCSGILDT